ncbi:MAG: hypothetical protein ACXWV2_01450 [Chitinophagaceae bacterium]
MSRQRNEKKLTLISNTYSFMGLNDLNLSASILAELYSTSLINPDQNDIIPPSQSIMPIAVEIRQELGTINETTWKYLGSNQKNILIVVDYDTAVHLPDEELNFLTNMLAACKLGLGDAAIVNLNNYKNTRYSEFLAQFKSKIVFLFGVEPSVFGLPVSFPYFQVQSVANCTFLYSPALGEQRKDALLKSKLWVSLRTIFGI